MSMSFDVPQGPHEEDPQSGRDRHVSTNSYGNNEPSIQRYIPGNLQVRWRSTLELYKLFSSSFHEADKFSDSPVAGTRQLQSALKDYFFEHLLLSSLARPQLGDHQPVQLIGKNSLYLDMTGDPGPLISGAFSQSTTYVMTPHEGCMLHAIALMYNFSKKEVPLNSTPRYWATRLLGEYLGEFEAPRDVNLVAGFTERRRQVTLERMKRGHGSTPLLGLAFKSLRGSVGRGLRITNWKNQSRRLAWKGVQLVPSCSGDTTALGACVETAVGRKFDSVWLQNTRSQHFGPDAEGYRKWLRTLSQEFLAEDSTIFVSRAERDAASPGEDLAYFLSTLGFVKTLLPYSLGIGKTGQNQIVSSDSVDERIAGPKLCRDHRSIAWSPLADYEVFVRTSVPHKEEVLFAEMYSAPSI